jgi:energy-coupling factor transporter ATPase
MIQVRNISYAYKNGGGHALSEIDMEIHDGSRIALVGPNGSGKTTLLRHLNGLLVPDCGEVIVDGLATTDSKALSQIRQNLGMVFQNPDNQIVGMTVEEDVAFGPENLRLPSGVIRKRVDRALERVGLSDFAMRAPHMLSSGEKQLVAIAGVLAMEPKHIALDEPTAYLDPAGRRNVLEVVKRLHKSGITIIHVTHDMEEAVDADEVLVLDKGRVVLKGRPSNVFSRARELRGLGLDIPVVTELMARLRHEGAEIRPGILTLDAACDELLDLIGNRGKNG